MKKAPVKKKEHKNGWLFPEIIHFLYFRVPKPQAMRAKIKSRIIWEPDLVAGKNFQGIVFSPK